MYKDMILHCGMGHSAEFPQITVSSDTSIGIVLLPKIEIHSVTGRSILKRKHLQEYITFCDAFLVLGLNKFKPFEPNHDIVKYIKDLLNEILKEGQPYYFLREAK